MNNAILPFKGSNLEKSQAGKQLQLIVISIFKKFSSLQEGEWVGRGKGQDTSLRGIMLLIQQNIG